MAPTGSDSIRRCVLAGVDMGSMEEAWHSRDRL